MGMPGRWIVGTALAGLFLLPLGLVSAGDGNGEEGGARRGGMRGRWQKRQDGSAGHGMRAKGRKWFLELPAVKTEVEKHRGTMTQLNEEMRNTVRETLEAAREQAEGQEVDRDAVAEQVKEVIAASASKMVDERVRHMRAMADLMEANRDTAIDKFIEFMDKKHEEHRQRRQEGGGGEGGRRQGGNPQGNAGNDFEGAIF